MNFVEIVYCETRNFESKGYLGKVCVLRHGVGLRYLQSRCFHL
jgi:hypothetical protein